MNSPNVALATVQYLLYQSEKQKYDTVGTIPKSNIKIIERGKINTLTHKYMTAHWLDLVHVLQSTVAGLN